VTENKTEAIVVLITAANPEEATRLAELMVEKRLAPCVQILPEMQSIYHWKGEVQRDREVLLLAKSTRARFDELEREVRAMHSYETPEIIALPVTAVSEPYLQWLMSEAGTIN
jgi:periplasmic divalent cation tolerance protein